MQDYIRNIMITVTFCDTTEESNWRNDYPDEDEWRSDGSSDYEMSSDNEFYRYQPIGKHGNCKINLLAV